MPSLGRLFSATHLDFVDSPPLDKWTRHTFFFHTSLIGRLLLLETQAWQTHLYYELRIGRVFFVIYIDLAVFSPTQITRSQ